MKRRSLIQFVNRAW